MRSPLSDELFLVMQSTCEGHEKIVPPLFGLFAVWFGLNEWVRKGRVQCDDQNSGRTALSRQGLDSTTAIEPETWLLLRACGTEPLMLICSESCSRESVARMPAAAKKVALGGEAVHSS